MNKPVHHNRVAVALSQMETQTLAAKVASPESSTITTNRLVQNLDSLGPKAKSNAEEQRRVLAQMSANVSHNRSEVDKTQQESFKSFLIELENTAEILSQLDKASNDYKVIFAALVEEFAKRVAEFVNAENLNQEKFCTGCILEFLGRRFAEPRENSENSILAQIILESDEEIVLDIVKDLLAFDSKDSTSRNFISTVASASLSENTNVFKSIFYAALRGTEDSEPKQRRRIIENLISLSPGLTINDKARYLLDACSSYEQMLLDRDEFCFGQRVILTDDDGNGGVVIYDDADISADIIDQSLAIEQKIEEVREEIISVRTLISELYLSKQIHPLLSADNLLDLLEQKSPLDTKNEGDFTELLEELDNEDIAKVFDADVLRYSFQAALKFARINPSQLSFGYPPVY